MIFTQTQFKKVRCRILQLRSHQAILWVEHQDKGWLELNFVIPNTELLTGKRLQPYFDRADRPRIDTWQTIVNDRLGLHDPNAPEKRRALVTPGNLPDLKQEAARAITRGFTCPLPLPHPVSLKRNRGAHRVRF
ncbi:hypothetical protein ACGVWS_10285 [Enterobacteriaceae bacterium LUAb1]